MNNKYARINAVLNLSFISISSAIILLFWLFKVDYFIYQEHSPIFFTLTDTEEIIQYFRKKELNFLLILSGIISIYLFINLVFFFISKMNNFVSKSSSKITILFILLFFINSAAAICSGMIIPPMIISFINSPSDNQDLLTVINHSYYSLIDYLIVAIFIQLIVINIVGLIKPSLYSKGFILHLIVVPCFFLPFFFI